MQTGGSRGLGFAMAREFLQAGDRLVICGRNPERLKEALAALQGEFGASRWALVLRCTSTCVGVCVRVCVCACMHVITLTA